MDLIQNLKNSIRFLKKLAIFVLIVAGFDMIIGYTLRYFYFSQKSGLLYRTTYSLEKTQEDIIILGPSTANHHYIPSMFEERFNMSCYNTGRDGNGIYFNLAVQKAILERYSPKIFILDIRQSLLEKDDDDLLRLSNLLPYYKTHPEIREIVVNRSQYEQLKLISQVYPFNSLLLTILAGNLERNKMRKIDYNGYVPLLKVMNDRMNDTIDSSRNYDDEKIGALKAFIENGLTNGIKVVIVKSPSFKYFKNEDDDIINTISREYNVTYLNYFNDTAFINHPELFMDQSHLNNDGAIKFSNLIIDKINREILETNNSSFPITNAL